MNRKLGDHLHMTRIERKETLRTAADGIGISAMYLSEIESGKKIPSNEKLMAISNYYKENYFELVSLASCSDSDSSSDATIKIAIARHLNDLDTSQLRQVCDLLETLRTEEKK